MEGSDSQFYNTFFEGVIAKEILNSIISGEYAALGLTSRFVKYVCHPDKDESSEFYRKRLGLGMLDSIKAYCNKRGFYKEQLECAQEDLEKRRFWKAASDILFIERNISDATEAGFSPQETKDVTNILKAKMDKTSKEIDKYLGHVNPYKIHAAGEIGEESP
jgi:hypothetical protein